MKSVEQRWESVFQRSYGSPKLNIIKGKGIYLVDENGKRYLDFIGGIATNVLGHSHPVFIKAIKQQSNQVAHVSNLYANPTSLKLAEKLIELTGVPDARVFLDRKSTRLNSSH